MGELFSFGGLLFVAFLVYMHLRSKNPANKLDKDGVMPNYAVNTFGYEINRDDFLWVSDLFKQYFPEGNCSISNYSYSKESTGKNILIVSTSIYFMQYYIRNGESENHELMLNGSGEIMSSIIYIERSITDTYSMYLFRKCELRIENEFYTFKGTLIDSVGIKALKSEFARWLRNQKEFADNFKNEIEVEKQKIITKQEQYDSEFYYPSKVFED